MGHCLLTNDILSQNALRYYVPGVGKPAGFDDPASSPSSVDIDVNTVRAARFIITGITKTLLPPPKSDEFFFLTTLTYTKRFSSGYEADVFCYFSSSFVSPRL